MQDKAEMNSKCFCDKWNLVKKTGPFLTPVFITVKKSKIVLGNELVDMLLCAW